MIVKRIWLHQIYNVKPVQLSSFDVLDVEIEPLSVSSSVIVRFQDEIVFVFINLDSSSQVSTLEPRFKGESIIIFILMNIEGWELAIFGAGIDLFLL